LSAVRDVTPELSTFLSADRRHAIASGATLPDQQDGMVLFADVAGFTPLTEYLADTLGPQRGAEEVAGAIQRIFDTLAEAVHRHRGSIITSAGDSLTCWFDADHRPSAVACALDMQAAVGAFTGPPDASSPLGLKVAAAGGTTHRLLVGDPAVQLFDVISGEAVDRAGRGEKACRPGEVVIDRATTDLLAGTIATADERGEFVLVSSLAATVPEDPWPGLAADAIDDATVRRFINPAVHSRLVAGHARFLAEFRAVGALFVSFDAEDTAALDSMVRLAQATVAGAGGSVFDVSTGDKGSYLFAGFGAPVAHGDDVRRAVTAAHELQRQTGGALRIGLHCGQAYAGLYSGRLWSTYTGKGDVINLSARLMMTASPGQVLMSAAVGSALDRRFLIQALGPVTVKGHTEPVAVCELVGTGMPVANLSEPRYPLPMVGRKTEREAIDAAVADAAQGRGGVLAFCADAGMGKSRLVNATILRAKEAGFATFAGQCQPHGIGSAYLPWRPIWNALLGLAADDPAEARQAALMSTLAAADAAAVPIAPLLSTLLDLPLEETDATRGMPAVVRKQLLEQFLGGALRGRAAAGPLCIAIEDLHWIDSLSRDLLGALAGAVSDVPVLLVLAYRPADLERLVAIAPSRELTLAELEPRYSSQLAWMLMTHMAGADPDPGTVATIVERANGNPFYIEELVREIVERGGSTSDLPTSLESLILGRIDRLPPSQQLTARVASVIGRRFPTAWLSGAYGDTLDISRLPGDLVGLGASGLIVADTPLPEEAYLFRHALVRDVAYETLSLQLREELHEQLARYLEEQWESPPVDLLAHHYAHTRNAVKEGLYRRLAAEVAIRNGAYADARAHVRRASQIAAAQPESPGKLETELELALLLGTILLVTDGQGAASAKAVYDRARELCKALPPGPAAGRAVFGLWTYYLFQGLMGPTAELADESIALAERSPDPGVRIMAHLAVSQTHMWTGQWQKCVDHFDEVLSLYDPGQHQVYITQYAQNPRFTASNSGFFGHWMLGHIDQAQAVTEAAIAEARQLNHEFTYTIAFIGRPLMAWFRRRHEAFVDSVGGYVETARRSGNPFYIALALSLDARARIVRGEVDAGLEQLEAQFETMRVLGSKLVDPLMVSLLCEGYLIGQRYDHAVALLDENVASFERDGRLSFVPDHLRLRAELLLRRNPGDCEAPLALLSQAMDVARSHRARSLELRAALSAARVLRALGHDDDARALVAPVYAGFTEGLADLDLREARAYLD
jgi:class 3 adenylate cyclase/tetratricopeptide (TPR) repeat protein